jgi:ssDNA-binding Zn-finger/Zn-ribbon topoisomerase 1
VLKFEGFLHYLRTDEDAESKRGDDEEARTLPPVRMGETLDVKKLELRAQETKPPSRYSQASLVREMEKLGIGRPSTYAATLKTLFVREYVTEEEKRIRPTSRGMTADALLGASFEDLIRADYTAHMEERLDEVAAGKRTWKEELRAWYAQFAPQLAAANPKLRAWLEAHPDVKAASPQAPKAAGRICPLCKKHELMVREGKKGPFASCPGWNDTPKCGYSGPLVATPWSAPCPKCKGSMEVFKTEHGRWAKCVSSACKAGFDPDEQQYTEPCPVCEGPMALRRYEGRDYARCKTEGCKGVIDLSPTVDQPCPACHKPMKDKGAFLGCSGYPDCRATIDKAALAEAKKAGRSCPQCQSWLIKKKLPGKEAFLGCIAYPRCNHRETVPAARRRAKTKRTRSVSNNQL